jgi:hypothetical protein
MLASITPLGERGRQSTWAVTVTAFALAASGAGASIGLAVGEVGALALPGSLSARSRLAVLLALAAVALAVDLRAGGVLAPSSGSVRARVPGPRRQVDESWLRAYRGWVYGSGYGAQLGIGIVTVVSSAATYVAVAAALLSGKALPGALIMGCYGAVRGLTPLLAARVDAPPELISFHRRFRAARRAGTVAGYLGLTAVIVAAVVGLASGSIA